MIVRKTTILLCAFLAAGVTRAQNDTSILMAPVEVVAPAPRQNPIGSPHKQWKSSDLTAIPSRTVGELMQRNGTFIKSYGLGSIATSSLRGGSSSHTAVLWNGLPINNPMLGLSDLSLLPTTMMDQIDLYSGGHSSNWGSGSVAGTINLSNQASFGRQTSLRSQTTVGSFGDFQQQLKLDLGSKKFHSTTNLFYHQAANDFPYTAAAGQEEIRQSNNALDNTGVIQSLYWKPSAKHQLSLHGWYQRTRREIPPQINQTTSLANQFDESIRVLGSHQWRTVSGLTTTKVAWFHDRQTYRDPAIMLSNNNTFDRYLIDLQHEFYLKRGSIQVGTSQSLSRAQSGNYAGPENDYRGALFINYRVRHKRWIWQADLRQAWTANRLIPISPSFAFTLNILDNLGLEGKVSRDYRLPALNDLYWRPGGNPDLLPERGWSEELGVKWLKQWLPWEMEYRITGFNRNIKDWILWSPVENQPFWQSQNLTKVWSRGVEQRLRVAIKQKNWTSTINLGYDWIKSTNQVPIEIPNLDKGEQLWYVPKHQWNATLSMNLAKWHFSYFHQQTGRYAGQNDELPGYNQAHISAGWTHNLFGLQGTLQGHVLNAWDSDIIIVENRPMPGRHYRISYIILFNQSN